MNDHEPTRIACLLVPDLPWVAVARAQPELAGRALAVAAAPGARADVLALSPEAQQAGVRLPCTVTHARAACADLEVRLVSPALEASARRALLDVALSASPRAEPAPPASGLHAAEAAVYLDASGTGSLFGSETGLAGALAARASRLGLPAVVTIAASRSVARIAARRLLQGWSRRPAGEPGPSEVIPAGGDAAFLAPLPLDLLDPPDILAQTLTRYGIRRVGDLLRLPRRALLSRIGAEGEPLLALARGQHREPPPAVGGDLAFEEAQDLEFSVSRLEPLLFVLNALLSRLCDRLRCRGLACDALEVRLSLTGGGRDARRVGIAAPTLDARVLLRLIALSLETRPPGAEIEAVALSTRGAPPRDDQLDFFRPPGPSPAALSRTLAELEALCGPGRVGKPAAVDTHRPDAFAVEPFAPGPWTPPRAPPESCRETPPPYALTVRALRPPVAAQVRAPRGRPEWVRSAVANGPVVKAAGPWRTTGNWWSPEEHFAFDHWDIATHEGVVARLRWDSVRHRWEIDALYD
jgi:protein ImuB